MAYSCPLCGAEANRKGRPFESVGAVVGHIDAKRDDLHATESGAAWRPSIVRSSSTVATDGADDTDDTDHGRTRAAGGTQDDALSHETRRAAAEEDPSPQQDPTPSDAPAGAATAATATLTTTDDDVTADVERRTHQTTNDEPSTSTPIGTSTATCPECGRAMQPTDDGAFKLASGWFTYKWIEIEPDAELCESCDVLHQSRRFYYGNQSNNPGWVEPA